MLMNGKWTSLCTLTICMLGILFNFLSSVDFIFKVNIFKKIHSGIPSESFKQFGCHCLKWDKKLFATAKVKTLTGRVSPIDILNNLYCLPVSHKKDTRLIPGLTILYVT